MQISGLKSDTDRGFTFQEQLDNVGLIHMNGRVYDPQIGRFISADPTIPEPLISESFNRYAYVNNNPLVYTDASGFDWCPGQKPTFKAINQIGAVSRCELAPIIVIAFPTDLGSTGVDLVPGGAPTKSNNSDPHPGGNKTPTSKTPQSQKQQTIPRSAANSSGNGLIVQLAYTDAHSSFGITIPDANHTFVIVSDPSTGLSYASRAGPGSGPGGGPGIGWDQVAAVSGPYDSRFPDYGSVTAVQTVGYLNVTYNSAVAYMDAYQATTNANDLRYEGTTQNSNSYAASLLSGMGFRPPDPLLNAPGYGSNPPSPQMECTK
jgi:RHS repeat-associated protein